TRVSFSSNPFNTLIPVFTSVEEASAYLATTEAVSTESFYWASRLIAALADAHYAEIVPVIERYQQRTLALGHATVHAAHETAAGADSAEHVPALLAAANTRIAEQIREATDALLSSVLFTASNRMANRFSRSDD